MTFKTFLQTLAAVMKFSELKPDAHGACLILKREDQLSLLFEWDDELVPNTILLSSELLSFPIDYRQDVYFGCLLANNATEETLSVKPDEDVIYLHRRIHPEIDEKSLEELLKDFTHVFHQSKSHFQNLLLSPPKQEKSPGPGMKIFPFKA